MHTGRNGKGKSTLLRALAARRVGNIPANVTVHYVSQEVELSEEKQDMTAVQIVIEADIERRLLLEEAAVFEAALQQSEGVETDSSSLSAEAQKRYGDVLEQLQIIGAESAERRAVELLENLGFTETLRSRPLRALSGRQVPGLSVCVCVCCVHYLSVLCTPQQNFTLILPRSSSLLYLSLASCINTHSSLLSTIIHQVVGGCAPCSQRPFSPVRMCSY